MLSVDCFGRADRFPIRQLIDIGVVGSQAPIEIVRQDFMPRCFRWWLDSATDRVQLHAMKIVVFPRNLRNMLWIILELR